MAPIEPFYQAGAKLDKAHLPKFANNQFYSIPVWLAGKWHHDQQVTYYTYDYETKEEDRTRHQDTARGDEEIGWQQDRLGGIWQYGNAPYTTIVKGDGHYVVQITKAIEPISVTPKQLVVRFVGIDLLVQNGTNVILSAQQSDKLQIYTQSKEYGPRYNRCVGSVKTFDQQGKPVRLSQVATIGVKVQPFTPTNVYDGKDIKLLFHQYLLSRKLNNLIPKPPSPPRIAQPHAGLRAKQGTLKDLHH